MKKSLIKVLIFTLFTFCLFSGCEDLNSNIDTKIEIRVLEAGMGYVTLEWDEYPDAYGYRILIPNRSPLICTSPTITIKELTCGTDYTAELQVYDSNRIELTSSTITFTTKKVDH